MPGLHALGAALRARAEEVADAVVARWLRLAESYPADAREWITRDTARTCTLGTLTLAHALTDGEGPTPEEWAEISRVGKAPADATITLADMTKLYFYWRDACIRVIDQEGERLGIDEPTRHLARAAVRAGSDASLVRTAKQFDRQRGELQARLAEEKARLSHLARHDSLTGLPNRHTLIDRLHELVETCSWTGVGAAVLFVDLDGFKAVNDAGGHAAGDRVLRAVAERMSEAVRPGDVVARFGGDEFVVLCPGLEVPAVEAEGIAERLRAALEGVASASIGVSLAGPGDDVDRLLLEADMAMYRNKQRSNA